MPETGQAEKTAGPVAAALAHFAGAPGNDRAALAACLRRPHAPLTEAEVPAIRARVLVVLGDRDTSSTAYTSGTAGPALQTRRSTA